MNTDRAQRGVQGCDRRRSLLPTIVRALKCRPNASTPLTIAPSFLDTFLVMKVCLKPITIRDISMLSDASFSHEADGSLECPHRWCEGSWNGNRYIQAPPN